ncbi:hypothetical protein AADG42_04890 [Ammonicoccus fulvus]|uniref:SAM-dependent methyltransferase n=1 Tax=Ammonicoccus fulvus TaxID=3138240 RepID=A0ABZ3FNH8_9ACTN
MDFRNRKDFPWWNPRFWSDEYPGEHFDTPSTLCGALLARLLADWVRQLGLTMIIDLGCGDGNLLNHLSKVAESDISLLGIDVRSLPDQPGVTFRKHYWSVSHECWKASDSAGPGASSSMWPSAPALAFAVEWLDDLPAGVSAREPGGSAHEIDPEGNRRPLSPADADWLKQWWPGPGRAVVGRTRDRAWQWLAERLPPGSILATIDYGHVRGDRPSDGGLAAHYRGAPVRPGAAGNTTAAVAVDALAAAVEDIGAERWWFHRLADLPPDFWPVDDDRPLTHLALRSQRQLLTDPAHFGNFWLVAHRIPARGAADSGGSGRP